MARRKPRKTEEPQPPGEAQRNRAKRDSAPPLDFETECPRCGTLFDVAASATEASCPGCSARLSLVEADQAPPFEVVPGATPEPVAQVAPDPEPAPNLNVTIAIPPSTKARPKVEPEPEPVEAVASPEKKWKDPVLTAKGVREKRKVKGASFFETPCPGCNTTLKVTEDARRGECPWCAMLLEFEDVVEQPVGEVVAPEPLLQPVAAESTTAAAVETTGRPGASPEPSVEPEEPVAAGKPAPLPQLAEASEAAAEPKAPPGAAEPVGSAGAKRSRAERDSAPPPQPVTVFEAVDVIEPTPATAPAPEPVPEPVPSAVPQAAVEAPKVSSPAIPITRETSPIVVVSTPPKEGAAPIEEVVGVTDAPPSAPVRAPPRVPITISSDAEILAPAEPVKARPKPAPVVETPKPLPAPAVAVTTAPAQRTAIEFADELEAQAKAEQEAKRRLLPALPILRREPETLTCPACRTEVPVPRGETAFQCPKCRQFLAAVDPTAASSAPKTVVPAFMKKDPVRRTPASVETVVPVLAVAKAAAPTPKNEAPKRAPVIVDEGVAVAPGARSVPMRVEETVELVAAPVAKRAESAKPLRWSFSTQEQVVPVAPAAADTKPKRFGFLRRKMASTAEPAKVGTPSVVPKKKFGFFGKKDAAPAVPPVETPVEAAGPEEAKPRFPLRRKEPVVAPAPVALESVEDLTTTVAPVPAEKESRRRFGLLGRRKAEPGPVAAPPVPEATLRTTPMPSVAPERVADRAPAPQVPMVFAIEEEAEEAVEPPAPAPEPVPEPAPEPQRVVEPIPDPISEPLPAAETAPEFMPEAEEPKGLLFGRFRRAEEEPVGSSRPQGSSGSPRPAETSSPPGRGGAPGSSSAEAEPTPDPEGTPVAAQAPIPEPILERSPDPEPIASPELTAREEPEPFVEPEVVREPEPEPLPAVETIPEPGPESVAEPLPDMSASGVVDPYAAGESFLGAPPGTSWLMVPETALLAPRELHRQVDRLLQRRGRRRRAEAEVMLLRARRPANGRKAELRGAPGSGVIVKTEGPRLVQGDFTLLRGVGPKLAESLRGAGYRTFGTFLGADPEKLALVLAVASSNVKAWQRDADLARVGLGDEEARWMRAVGVPTVSRLAAANARTLTRRLGAFARDHELDRVPDEATVAGWVRAAKRKKGHSLRRSR